MQRWNSSLKVVILKSYTYDKLEQIIAVEETIKSLMEGAEHLSIDNLNVELKYQAIFFSL